MFSVSLMLYLAMFLELNEGFLGARGTTNSSPSSKWYSPKITFVHINRDPKTAFMQFNSLSSHSSLYFFFLLINLPFDLKENLIASVVRGDTKQKVKSRLGPRCI